MLRPLLLVTALGSAAAQCAGGATPRPQLCQKLTPTVINGHVESPSDATALTPPQWNCDALELISGLVVPITIELINTCAVGDDGVAGRVLQGGTIKVYFACTTSSCSAGATATTNVLVDANSYTKVDGIDTSFTLDGVGHGTITINQDIPLDAGATLAIGTIWTKASSFAEIVNAGKTSFTAFAVASEDYARTDDLTTCPEPAFGSGSLGVTGKFLISPPPPPPPPDCCSQNNRNCLARCEQCLDPGISFDKKGVACSVYCDVSCASYPSTESKDCFARCSQCTQGHSVDIEGQACDPFCNNCIAYDKCMKGGDCLVGCVEGRRERKLLFAPIPVCVPCCKPIV